MNIATIRVSGVQAIGAEVLREIPAGISGATIQLEYTDSIWAGLNKAVIFRGNTTKEVLTNETTVTVPAEVVAEPRSRLRVGIYGTDSENNVIMPTLWAQLGVIADSAEPSAPASSALPIWAQLWAMIGDLAQLHTTARNNLVAAINELVAKGGGSADPEAIKKIVDEYLKENIPEVDLSDVVKSVNGVKPDPITGNVEIEVSGGNANYNPVPKTAEMTIPVGVDEFGRLWVAPIYAPIEPTVTYAVTSGLNNVESSNPSAVIAEGKPYTATLTATEGYEIGKVTVTMGGVDITADVYADGVINISAVTGDVIITATAAAVPTDIMSNFKYLGMTTYSPGTYTAWCPTGLIYDESRDVYAHFMNVQPSHYSTPSACELWFNTIDPETLDHTKPVFIARTAEKLTGTMVSSGALGCCIKDGKYYMFSRSEIGYYSSEDGGATWEHKDYETAPDACPWGCYVLDNGRMIMGSDTQNHKVYYSDDNGKNWTIVQSEHFNEPTFIDFGGGTIMAICRENMDSEKNIQKPWMHVSNDYGATWTPSVTMETVGYMGNNNCNAYVHDGYVELFVGCRIPTDSPQYTDTLYQINQYVLDMGKGAVDEFEFVNTVYQYKDTDNPLGISGVITPDDFSTPCIAIKDKAHSLLAFYAPGQVGVTHHFIAVGNIPVDDFEIPSIIPESYAVSQTFSNNADDTTVTVCDTYNIGVVQWTNYPKLQDGYLKLDDIADGGFVHVRLLSQGFGGATNTQWRIPAFVHVKDGAVLSANTHAQYGLSPMPSGMTKFVGRYANKLPELTKDEPLDIYAFIDGDYWWFYALGTWVRVDSGDCDVTTLTTTGVVDVNYPYKAEGLTTYKVLNSMSANWQKIAMIEYDKATA